MVLNSLIPDYDVAWECHNLGLLYADHGKLVEAEQMYQWALQGYEKAWGLDHTSTLDTVNNLAALYKNQGKLVDAEQMYQRALQGKEKAWGLDHTSTLDTVNNLRSEKPTVPSTALKALSAVPPCSIITIGRLSPNFGTVA
jgi:tetratricopeptide (TPR) repeat protein